MKNILDKNLKAYQDKKIYDYDSEIIHDWYTKRIIKYSENAKSLLELGLGHGYTTDIFSRNFKRYVVLEGSPAVIKNFKKNHPFSAFQIIETDFESYNDTEKYDIINMGFILEHVHDPSQILIKYKEFLMPGGKVFVSVPNAEALNRRLGYLAGLLPDITLLSENDLLLGHKRYYTVESLSMEIRNAGYKIDFIEGIYLKPFTTQQMLTLNFGKDILSALCKMGVDYPELSCSLLAQIS